ncbi:hypothetical protein PanWU01x14_032920, partial [Parasponia andersonii]
RETPCNARHSASSGESAFRRRRRLNQPSTVVSQAKRGKRHPNAGVRESGVEGGRRD